MRTGSARRLASALLGVEAVAGVTLDGDEITVSTTRAGELASALPRLARDTEARLVEVRPIDDSLESMFRELVR